MRSRSPADAQQIDLTFGARSRHRTADTSDKAAERKSRQTATAELRRRILSLISDVTPRECLPAGNAMPGWTADELSSVMSVDLYEVRRRVSDLHHAGLITDSGRRRETATGSPAIVWRKV